MNRLGPILIASVFALGIPGTALAQTVSPAHEHGQAPAATQQPAPPHQQHHGMVGMQQGHQQPGEHQDDCECCRRMMEMMRRHGTQQSGAAPAQADEHQQHRGERPN